MGQAGAEGKRGAADVAGLAHPCRGALALSAFLAQWLVFTRVPRTSESARSHVILSKMMPVDVKCIVASFKAAELVRRFAQ